MIIQVWSLSNVWGIIDEKDIFCIICGKKLDKNEKNFFIDYDFYCNNCKDKHIGEN